MRDSRDFGEARRLDDTAVIVYPACLLVTGGILLAGSVVVLLGCLVPVRRAPGPALLGPLGGRLAGTANPLIAAALVLALRGRSATPGQQQER